MTVSHRPPTRTRRLLEWATVMTIVIAGAWVTWVRVPADHRRRPWAEDANIFLDEAVRDGAWNVIVHGYAGYQHLIPRLVVAVIYPFFDVVRYPMLIFAICSVLVGLAAAAVYWLSRDLVPWIPARLTLAAITMLLPLATQETIGNLADLHVYAMWIMPWLLLYRPRRWSTGIAWALLAFALVMTEIQCVFFFWLIPFRARRARARAFPIFAAFLVGAAWQIVTALLVPRATSEGPLSVGSTFLGWMVNTVIPLVQADPVAVRNLIHSSGLLVAWIILIPIAAATVIALWKGTSTQRLLTIALILGSAATYTGSAWANSQDGFRYAEFGLDHIDTLIVNIRYGVPSGMLLSAVIPLATAILVSRARRADAAASPGRRVAITTAISVIACIAVVGIMGRGDLHPYSLRATVAEWPSAVIAAMDQCGSARPPDTVTLPVAPWRSLTLTCTELLSLRR